MSDKVRNIFRRGKLTEEQIAHHQKDRRLVMREFPPLQYVLVWFEKEYGQFRGCEVVRGIQFSDLRNIFGVPSGESMEGSHTVGPAQAAELSRYLDRPIDLTQYSYRMRSQVAEMLPLEELSPVHENEPGHEDAA